MLLLLILYEPDSSDRALLVYGQAVPAASLLVLRACAVLAGMPKPLPAEEHLAVLPEPQILVIELGVEHTGGRPERQYLIVGGASHPNGSFYVLQGRQVEERGQQVEAARNFSEVAGEHCLAEPDQKDNVAEEVQ